MRVSLLVTALLFAAAEGYAQSGGDSTPSATYARAVDLLEAHQAQQAAELLERLVASDPAHGRAWYNLALASRELGRPARAVEAFERALALDPRSFSRRQQRAMRALSDELRARCGTLTLAVTPAGAEVRVAGRALTSGATGVLLDAGTHSVEVRAQGHQAQTREVSITAGAATALTLSLEREASAPQAVALPEPVVVAPPPPPPPRPRLLVEPSPAGALVRIDDEDAASGRVEREVEPGSHVVRVSAEGHVSTTRTVHVGRTGLTRVDASLSRRGLPGWVVPVSVVGGILVAGGVTTAIILGTQSTTLEVTNWGNIVEGGGR